MSIETRLPDNLMNYSFRDILDTQQKVYDKLYSTRQRTDADIQTIAEEFSNLDEEQQKEYIADLSDYLLAHFNQQEYLNVDTRLEQLYSSFVINPNRPIGEEHIDSFTVAALGALSCLSNDQEATNLSNKIIADRRTALRIGSRGYFPLQQY